MEELGTSPVHFQPQEASWVKSETGPSYMEGMERLMKEAHNSTWQVAVLRSEGIYTQGLS